MMGEITLRPLQCGDFEAVSQIWHVSFGDAPEDVLRLMRLPGAADGAVCAEENGAVRGAMLAFDGLRLGGARASYLYALCVSPEERGRGVGRTVYLETARRAFSRGAELVCIHAASPELERWYASFSETRILSRAVWKSVLAAEMPGLTVRTVTPEEYASRRRKAAPEMPDIMPRVQALFSPGSLMLAECGGASAPLCAEMRGDALCVREPADEALAAGVAFCFGTAQARVYMPSRNGDANLMGIFAPGVRAEEPFLPLLLD